MRLALLSAKHLFVALPRLGVARAVARLLLRCQTQWWLH